MKNGPVISFDTKASSIHLITGIIFAVSNICLINNSNEFFSPSKEFKFISEMTFEMATDDFPAKYTMEIIVSVRMIAMLTIKYATLLLNL
jgi:hypothetical protein